MTRRMTHMRRGPALPAAAIAALLLAGCSSGHVGDSWQCPLATGGACASVAAADPAVPNAGAARGKALTGPLWRQRAGAPKLPPPEPCESDCGSGFDPFGWLMRLFGGDKGEDRAATEEREPDAAAYDREPAETHARTGERETLPLPAEPERGQDDPSGDSLRSGEVVARIWIAPFVDAGGVYREASHVWIVLEPAGWKLLR
ncbi:MAG: TraV family lipoprotein [Rhodospirillaceae bacterium]|nr:TraV family lipoprotein [Rhodospirillaceae bacterium]MYF86443.1 TraV family lipoprotein [Rhodospirillaceae bacterium]MYK13854.1 TraV family lipoprotein [Rhodospirillaceae bacterium]